jgi:hypothetical protein
MIKVCILGLEFYFFAIHLRNTRTPENTHLVFDTKTVVDLSVYLTVPALFNACCNACYAAAMDSNLFEIMMTTFGKCFVGFCAMLYMTWVLQKTQLNKVATKSLDSARMLSPRKDLRVPLDSRILKRPKGSVLKKPGRSIWQWMPRSFPYLRLGLLTGLVPTRHLHSGCCSRQSLAHTSSRRTSHPRHSTDLSCRRCHDRNCKFKVDCG